MTGPLLPDGGVGEKSLGNVRIQPYFLKTPDFYSIGQERMAHDEAVYAYGEYAFFALLWNAIDYSQGLVGHCPQCYSTNDGISEVYNQPSFAQCNICYGTLFFLPYDPTTGFGGVAHLGGLKALIVRPCMWNPTDESQKLTGTGEIITSTSTLQSISDFRMRTADIILKADGTRWRVATHNTDSIISGFQASNDVRAMIGYNYGQVVRQDESMPCFLIPPPVAMQVSILDTSVIPNYPVSFAGYEYLNCLPSQLIGDDSSNPDFQQPDPIEGE
jgi:hypothetical protein